MWTSVIDAYKIFQKFVPCTWSVMLIFPEFTWPKRSYYLKWKVNRHDAATLYWGKDCPWTPVLKLLLETQMYCVITEFWFTEWTISILRQLCPFLVSLYSSSAFQYCLVDILATESFPNNLPFYKEKEARR